MSFNDSIILTFSSNGLTGRKGKIVLPRSWILSLFTNIEKNYTTNQEEERTYVRISADNADLINAGGRIGRNEKYVDLVVEEELKVVLALVQGGKGAEVLFGQK